MTISNELLDELLKGCARPEDLLGEAGLMKELKLRLMERMLGAELTAHLGYEAGAEPPAGQANRRNGGTTKRVKGQDGEMPLTVPRDRDGSFEPEPRDPQIDQNPRLIPDRGRSHQTDLSRHPQLRERRQKCARMVRSPQSIRSHVRQTLQCVTVAMCSVPASGGSDLG